MSLRGWNKTNHERPNTEDKRKIRLILNMTENRAFPRCPGKSKQKLKELREAGDFSHDPDEHICNECRCGNIAGDKTGGDFYNIGKATGHYGVGFCSHHEQANWTVERAQSYARTQMELIRSGVPDNDPDNIKSVMKVEEERAVQAKQVRNDIELVVNTLDEFKRKLDPKTGSTQLTEWVFRGKELGNCKESMSDKTRMMLGLEIAKTLSKMNLDYFKIDKDHFIHVDEVKMRLPRMIDHVQMCLVYMKEQMVKYVPGDTDPIVLTMEKIITGFRDIWKSGIR